MAAYLILNILVLSFMLGLFRKRLPGKGAVMPILILFVLTAVFDSVIIVAGIVGYDPAEILGVKLGVIPIEDFFYTLAAGLVVPALWKGYDE